MKKYIFILLALILFNCGSKKKIVNTTKSELDLKVSIDSTLVKSSITQEKTKDVSVSEEIEKEESFEYEGEKGDSLKIIKKGSNGKIISETIYTGKGKITKTSKSKKKNESLENSKSNSELNSSKLDLKKDIHQTKKDKSKEAEITRSGFSFTTLLWILLILGVVAAIYYLNKRFGFIKRAINFLLTL